MAAVNIILQTGRLKQVSSLMRALIAAIVCVRGERGAFVATHARTGERRTLDEPVLFGRFRPLRQTQLRIITNASRNDYIIV